MTRARALWLAAAVFVLAAAAYVVRRRGDRPQPAPGIAPAPAQVTAGAAAGISAGEVDVADTWQRFEEASAVPSDEGDAVLVDDEQPLATWIRVAIVLVALVAFFAVSLIATKQV